MIFTLYTGDNCPNCKTVKTFMEENGIKFEERNAHENPNVMRFLKSRGHGSIPQVYLNGAHISAFKDFKTNLFNALNKGG